MPLIKIDYNETIIDDAAIDELIQSLLEESMRIFNCNEDKISIFTAAYGKHHFSTAATEIELRAKLAEYDKPGQDRNEVRLSHMAEYKQMLNAFIQKHQLPKGVVFTITFEDWQVEWHPGV